MEGLGSPSSSLSIPLYLAGYCLLDPAVQP